ncbi:MAG: DUF5717 family protein [Lachnospiraceae bacterium]|nr:DUF5717 family protein [Lachnospiraceae bacterium]
MKRVIDNINNGKIDRIFGTLTFSVSSVEHTVRPGAICEGSFSVTAASGNLTEGYVYTDDYRMECLTTEFTGTHDEIAYRFRTDNLIPGRDVTGNFILITNRGEYQIPFTIHSELPVLESSMGPIRNIFHFTNLAKAKWNEALKLFYDPAFSGIFTDSDREYLPLYRVLSGVRDSERNMDEFLISVKKKTAVEYIPSEKSIEISDPDGMSRFDMDITRNGWGYTSFAIETEGDFISVEEQTVDFDAFLGNKYQLYYYIDSSKLHSGKNFGAIILKTDRTDTVIPVTVSCTVERMYLKDMTRIGMQNIVALMERYEAHRLKKISTRTWLQDSTEIVDDMLANDPEDLRARLYRIHLMITKEHNNEALWNLKKVRPQAQSIKTENSYLWCYYLYLNSLIDEDDMDMETLIDEVEYCYKTDPDNWRLCWLLSVMSDDYKDSLRRWDMYEEAYRRGCNSPAIYMEASKIVLENPALITKLEGFDMQVIRYMCKKGVMNDDIAMVVLSIAEHFKDYSPTIVRLLMFCYKDSPHDDLLTVICSQLIKGGKRDLKAHTWYGYAVNKNLKITRLFEYYMLSKDKSELTEIPRFVLMYFSFQSDLDFETNAYLYAYVVSHKDDDPDMYSKYKRQISEYVSDQLAAGHNNRYLARLYREFVDEEMLTDPVRADQAANIIFIHEIDTSKYPDARFCILSYEHTDTEEAYPIIDGKAEVPIYSEDYCIALEDSKRNRSVGTVDIEPELLIQPGRILLNAQLLVKEHTGVDTNMCMDRRMAADVRPENEFRFKNLLKKGVFSKDFAQSVNMKLARFYFETDRVEQLDSFLDNLSAGDIADYERAECIRLLINRGLHEKAMRWIYEYGPEGVDKVVISDLIYSWLPVYIDEPGEYERLLSQLIIATIQSGRVNQLCIQYLMAHINGSVRTMRTVWLRAGELEADRRDIEEKMLIQILYTGAYIPERAGLLQSYAYNNPDKDVVRATLNSAAYEDFVEGAVISDNTYKVMVDAYESGFELDRVCDLAFVRHMAGNQNLIDDRTRPILKDALHRLLADDIVISCFKDLSGLMPSMARFEDSCVIEYRTESGNSADIHYIIESEEGDYQCEPMNEVCKGVFSKMFTLFFGEKIMYYITESAEDLSGELSESGTLSKNDMGVSDSKGRYGLVDDMCIARALKDYTTVDTLMEEYYRRDYLSDKLFGMHKELNNGSRV